MLGEQDLPAFGEVRSLAPWTAFNPHLSRQAWARYDPDNKRRLHHSDVLELLKDLKPPLGFESSMLKKVAYAKMMRMQAPLHDDGTIDFNAALLALIRIQVRCRSLDGIRPELTSCCVVAECVCGYERRRS